MYLIFFDCQFSRVLPTHPVILTIPTCYFGAPSLKPEFYRCIKLEFKASKKAKLSANEVCRVIQAVTKQMDPCCTCVLVHFNCFVNIQFSVQDLVVFSIGGFSRTKHWYETEANGTSACLAVVFGSDCYLENSNPPKSQGRKIAIPRFPFDSLVWMVSWALANWSFGHVFWMGSLIIRLIPSISQKRRPPIASDNPKNSFWRRRKHANTHTLTQFLADHCWRQCPIVFEDKPRRCGNGAV